ncbi:MAG: CoA-binding protein [SAR92 clade bacterium]|uniref:CoA-binding protein n=1 Tax=SAR92 clade bacterium TaxID=2315479 RepID=A0A520MDX3_9GAMM|nr:MAG: CoA-binding protein [SAR92 clade bacterium]
MNHDHYSDEYLKDILTEVQSIALVGASPRADRDSHIVMNVLLEAGYQVIPVNPREAGNSILGQTCYGSLAEIDIPVDMVEIFRSSEAALGVTKEAIAIGAKVIWMQLQIVNHQAAQMAESSGIKVVMDRCPKLELQKTYWTDRET